MAGVQYAWKAGFDPKVFVMLIDWISEQEYAKNASFFRTHPDIGDRILSVFSEIEFLPESRAGVGDSIKFHQMEERIGK